MQCVGWMTYSGDPRIAAEYYGFENPKAGQLEMLPAAFSCFVLAFPAFGNMDLEHDPILVGWFAYFRKWWCSLIFHVHVCLPEGIHLYYSMFWPTINLILERSIFYHFGRQFDERIRKTRWYVEGIILCSNSLGPTMFGSCRPPVKASIDMLLNWGPIM